MPMLKVGTHAAMKFGLTAIVMMASAGLSQAQSIDPIASEKTSSDSVVSIACQTCPALKPRRGADAYVVHDLKIGTRKWKSRKSTAR